MKLADILLQAPQLRGLGGLFSDRNKKESRNFLMLDVTPLFLLTYSRHWIAHPGFKAAIGHFLGKEKPAMLDYVQNLLESSSCRREE